MDNELSGAVDVGEFCDSEFAAPEGFCSNQLDTVNKLNLHSEIWGSQGSEYQYYVILGYDIIALIYTDVSEKLLRVSSALNFEFWEFSVAGN